MDDRPSILVASRVDLAVEEATRALVEAGPTGPVYRSGGCLVRVRDDDWIQEPWTVEGLRARLSEVADYRDGKKTGECAPPPWLARAILDLAPTAFPRLRGVTRCPVFRPPTNLVREGYDAESALLVRAPEVTVGRPGVSTAALVEEVLAPWAEFPFVDETDRAALLALLLTVVRRSAVDGPVPLFIIRAPKGGQGTGKSALAHLVGLATLGLKVEALLPAKNEEENRKRLLALAMSNQELILLDNLDPNSAFDSPSLAAAVTGGRVLDRLLGSSRMISAELPATWILTGNELRLTGDLPRRAVWIRLDARCAHPQLRKGFRKALDALFAETRANRERWLGTILTLVHRFHLADAPVASPLGSFESWDREVRRPTTWALGVDPVRPPEPDPLAAEWQARNLPPRLSAHQILQDLADTLPSDVDSNPISVGRWLQSHPAVRRAGRGAQGTIWELAP